MDEPHETILIVEDDPGMARLESLQLGRRGYVTHVAGTAEEAAAAVRGGGIDLIVLDQRLDGGTTGLELYEQLQTAGYLLPAILVTGVTDETTLRRAIRAGLRDFLPKSEDFLDNLAPIVSRVMEQVRIERRLAESEARLAGIIASALDGIATLDSDDRISMFNPAAEAIFGVGSAGAVGRPIRDFIPGWPCSSDANHTVNASGSDAGPQALRRECQGVRHEGERFPLELSSSIVAAAGRSFRTLILRDLTDEKRAESERAERIRAEIARAEAESANRAKDRFLAVLSHELRTPLTPILMVAESRLAEPDPAMTEDLRSDLEMIRRNIRLETRLIEDLLDVSKIVQGKLLLKLEVVDLHAVVRQTIETCRAEVTAAGLELSVELCATETRVRADPARLQQVFWNLIKNAVKFTPAGGRLTLRSRNDPSSDEGAESLITVEVEDTGQGIEAAFLATVFKPFEQGGHQVTRSYGGLGLGLAISRSVATAHGGSLHVRSEGKGRGATFSLTLQTVPEPTSPEAVQPAPPAAGGAPVRDILLVEDSDDTAVILSRLLRRRGYEVRTAPTFAAALNEAEGGRVDLLICDVGLPDGSGIDLMQQLRQRHPGLKGIAMSGFGQESDVRRSHEAGFAAHMTKPIDFPALEEMIRRVSAVTVGSA